MKLRKWKHYLLSAVLIGCIALPGMPVRAEVLEISKKVQKPNIGAELNFKPLKHETKLSERAKAHFSLDSKGDKKVERFYVEIMASEGINIVSPKSFEVPTKTEQEISYTISPNIDGKIMATVTEFQTNGKPTSVRKLEFNVVSNDETVLHGDGVYSLTKELLEKEKKSGKKNEKQVKQEKKKLNKKGAKTSVVRLKDKTATEQFHLAAVSNQLEVSGQVLWTDAEGNTHPAEGVNVQILDEDNIFDDFITTIQTDKNGEYSASFDNDAKWPESGYDIFVRISTEGDGFVVTPAGDDEAYEIDSDTEYDIQNGSSVGIDITTNQNRENGEAFSVHQAMLMAAKYTKDVNGSGLPNVKVFFPDSSGGSASYYDGDDLHLLNGDGFDWDVIHHEYGHHAANILNIEDNPGGEHNIGQSLADLHGKDEGLRLAWGEAWPTFYAISLQWEMNASALGVPNVGDVRYQDTDDANFAYNLEDNESEGIGGEDNEVSIQRALWDLYDIGAEIGDGVSLGDHMLWNRLKQGNPVNFSEAYQSIIDGKTIKDMLPIGTLLATHGISPTLTKVSGILSEETIPTFSWSNSGGNDFKHNEFQIEFYNEDYSKKLLTIEEISENKYKPTKEEWKAILTSSVDRTLHWVVKASQTSSPITGPYLGGEAAVKRPSSVDVAFVVDTTGSMWDDIYQVKNSIGDIVDRLNDQSADFRISITEFKDFNHSGGDSSDYPYRAIQPFTADRSLIQNSVQTLSATGGGDWPESVYSGLMNTILGEGIGEWRADAERVIILMGDAPPKDPEPETEYTMADVIGAANKGGILVPEDLKAKASTEGINIHSIVIGEDYSTKNAFTSLSDGTGGKVFTALTASDVVDSIMEAIGSIGTEPDLNQAPDTSGAKASISEINSVNHKMVSIDILDVVDPDGDPVQIEITGITQDEAVNEKGKGKKEVDGEGIGTNQAQVRAERAGNGNGRVYHITFRARDDKGAESVGSVVVGVRHDMGENHAIIDDGQLFISTTP
ncbi:vWA domain-containing protein [Bacillus sp. JJ1609]|uniref:vWA domain-containing protein n=1 Tax=Bacillus sp. JJ1609 TaxID=3122977 RepID=UPI002FFEB201